MIAGLKSRIVGFWNKKPCGTMGVVPVEPDSVYFEKIRIRRYKLEPFIRTKAVFESRRGKKVLEIGCGVGTDGLEFMKAGADYTGIDASEQSVRLARKNFKIHGFSDPAIKVADAESLPFPDKQFDFVYSWGVIHHTPNIEKAIQEIRRILKDNGRFCVMIYNRRSLVGLQLWFLYALLRGRPFLSLKALFAEHHESPGTQAFTDTEAAKLFHDFKDVEIIDLVTPYDLRLSRNIYLPNLFSKFVPSRFGFFKVVTGSN